MKKGILKINQTCKIGLHREFYTFIKKKEKKKKWRAELWMNSDIVVIDSLTITWFLVELIKNYLDKGDSNTQHHHLANGLQDF